MIVHLKTPIIIEKSIEITNAKGTKEPGWQQLKNIYADVNYNSGSTQYDEHFTSENTLYTFLVRYDSDIYKSCKKAARVIYNNEYFKIEAIKPLENNKYMQLITSLTYE